MRCDEIKERFVDLLYHEQGTPSASPELQAHFRSCPNCQKELAELKDLQTTLKVWRDEPPLRPVTIPRPEPVHSHWWFPNWHMARYAAIAVLVTLAFLGLSNASIRWDRNGFSFRTSLLPNAAPAPLPSSDFFTKEETQAIVQRIMEETRDDNIRMAHQVLDTVDQERATEYRSIARQIKESRSKN